MATNNIIYLQKSYTMLQQYYFSQCVTYVYLFICFLTTGNLTKRKYRVATISDTTADGILSVMVLFEEWQCSGPCIRPDDAEVFTSDNATESTEPGNQINNNY